MKGKNIDNLSKVFFILEKDNTIDYSISTHADIENISIYPNEKEVLFFPFSSFEIKDIEEQIINNEKIYRINLKYLGKYIKEFQYEEKEIPNSIFKEEILKSGLIEKNKIENKKVNQLFNDYIEYKNKLNIKHKINLMKEKDILELDEISEEKSIENNKTENENIKQLFNSNIENSNGLNFKNKIKLIYEKEKNGIDKIFGAKFVANNKQKIELIINGKKKN